MRAQRAGRIGRESPKQDAAEAQRLQRHTLVLRQQLKVPVQQRLAPCAMSGDDREAKHGRGTLPSPK